MMNQSHHKLLIAMACMLLGVTLDGSAFAQSSSGTGEKSARDGASAKSGTPEAAAVKHVNDAAAVVRRMQSEPRIGSLIQDAKGIFVMPNYVRAAVGLGGGGGAGVLLVRRDDGSWRDPAFFHAGAVSAGLQVGVEAGPVAFVLNNQKAVNHFLKRTNFALNADSGLTVINWAVLGTAAPGDVTAWSGSKGLFGNVAAVGVSDIRFSHEQTSAYYHQPAFVEDVIKGTVRNSQADPLRQAVAASPTKVLSGPGSATPAK